MEYSLTTSTSSTHILSILLFLSLFFNCLSHFGFAAQLLPEEEVQTLKTIAEKLRVNDWPSITRSSCNGAGDWNNISANLGGVYCDCSFSDVNDTVCHVVSFVMKDFNLTGVIPEEFADLRYLQIIDLTRNYIGGSLPKTLGKLFNFTKLSLTGNRISGSIPDEISEIATLKELVLENNQVEGFLPPSLGNLRSLQKLALSANNFSGTIPKEFEKLTNLSDFRIDGNGISGPIPDFIGNWKNLTRLDMQGTSMEGPFPPTISQLTNLVDLRVSDLKGPEMKFPQLGDMKKMKTLILRNCFIKDSIPDYIGELPELKLIDLSFNQLTGRIPDNIGNLVKLNYLFLANNSLSRDAPGWMVNIGVTKLKFVDASYNNFTNPPQSAAFCQISNVNLVSSYPSSEDNRTSWCLKKDLSCSQKPKYHELYINCGGEEIHFEGKKYEADPIKMDASQFIAYEHKWACSRSGVFVGAEDVENLAKTASRNLPDVYTTARLAPTSLKYYGLCLRKGSYKVHLHFAEIVISNNLTANGIGRRIFDVSVQGKVVLKDFNIAKEANGTDKVYIKEIKEVVVSGSTMEIHLYWAGKGTNAIPARGVYGPLISAITITPNYNPDPGLSIGAIIGIVAASCVVLVLILIVLRMKGCFRGKDREDKGY